MALRLLSFFLIALQSQATLQAPGAISLCEFKKGSRQHEILRLSGGMARKTIKIDIVSDTI
jgi:hypothetical protein